MSGPVSTHDFTSRGVSQASCANQQHTRGLESGRAQDTGCTSSYKAFIQTYFLPSPLSNLLQQLLCSERDVADGLSVRVSLCPALGWLGYESKFLPLSYLGVHTLHSIHQEDVFVSCWGWHGAQDRWDAHTRHRVRRSV